MGSAEEDASNGCKCPEGYTSTRPANADKLFDLDLIGSNTPPFYSSENDVVTYYSRMVKDASREYSGLIYYLEVKGTEMYSITGFDISRKPGDRAHSPGPDELKPKLPAGAKPVAHIHNHYKGLPSGNQSFSGYYGLRHPGTDMDDLLGKNRWHDINYWVLGNKGYLSKYFADNTPRPDPLSMDPGDAGQIHEYKGEDFYKNPPGFPPCPCFKIK